MSGADERPVSIDTSAFRTLSPRPRNKHLHCIVFRASNTGNGLYIQFPNTTYARKCPNPSNSAGLARCDPWSTSRTPCHSHSKLASKLRGDCRWRSDDCWSTYRRSHRNSSLGRAECCWTPRWVSRRSHCSCCISDQRRHDCGVVSQYERVLRYCYRDGSEFHTGVRSNFWPDRWLGGKHCRRLWSRSSSMTNRD